MRDSALETIRQAIDDAWSASRNQHAADNNNAYHEFRRRYASRVKLLQNRVAANGLDNINRLLGPEGAARLAPLLKAGPNGKPVMEAKDVDQVVERLLTEEAHQGLNHGDIVELQGRLRRPGYWKVDCHNAIGSSPQRPWVDNLDTKTGFYIDPSDLKYVSVVLPADRFDTDNINSSSEVETALADLDGFEDELMEV